METIAIDKPNLVYPFNSSNFNIYFSLGAPLLNGSAFYNSDLKRFLTQSVEYYVDGSFTMKVLETEDCSNKKINEFLLLESQNDNSTNKKRLCIKDGQNITMGMYFNQTSNNYRIPYISYLIKKCVNSSENNFSCATNEEINQMIKNTTIQVTVPKSIYDFNDVLSPRKRSFDYKFYYLDPSFSKLYTNYLIPNYLLTDVGILNEDYRLNSIDFNTGSLDYELMSFNQGGAIFEYDLRFDFNQQFYYRKNQKIYQIFANIGGTINFYILIGNLICYYFNALILRYLLVNISFVNLNEPRKKLLFILLFIFY